MSMACLIINPAAYLQVINHQSKLITQQNQRSNSKFDTFIGMGMTSFLVKKKQNAYPLFYLATINRVQQVQFGRAVPNTIPVNFPVLKAKIKRKRFLNCSLDGKKAKINLTFQYCFSASGNKYHNNDLRKKTTMTANYLALPVVVNHCGVSTNTALTKRVGYSDVWREESVPVT